MIRKRLSNNFRALLGLAVVIAFTFTSCSSTKVRGLFTDLPDNDIIHLPPMPYEERVIEPGDFLMVQFSGSDAEAVGFITRPPVSGGANGQSGYQVDPSGNIEFPLLGKIKVAGLTTTQAKESLTKSSSVFIKNPLVDVSYTTFRISVIGVGAGIKELPVQRNTLLEGLAMAGEIEQRGKLYDVRLFREYKGQRTVYQIDLRNKAVLNNPEIFQLRHNDVIYVKTKPSTLFREDFRFFSSVFSFAVGIVTLGFAIANRN